MQRVQFLIHCFMDHTDMEAPMLACMEATCSPLLIGLDLIQVKIHKNAYSNSLIHGQWSFMMVLIY